VGEHRLHLGFECGAVLHPLFVGRKSRVLAPFRVPEGRGTARPDRLAGGLKELLDILAQRGIHCVTVPLRSRASVMLEEHPDRLFDYVLFRNG